MPKISELTTDTALSGSETAALADGAATKKVPLSSLGEWVLVMLGRASVAGELWSGNSTSSGTVLNTLALTGNGTTTARNVATTNRLTRAKRLGYAGAAGAGNYAGRYNTWAQFTVGDGATPAKGGFRAVFRWGCSDAAAVAGALMFVGLSSSIVAPSPTTGPETLTNQVGVAQIAGSANLQIVYGGSAAQTAIDLGAGFPAADTAAWYQLELEAKADEPTKVHYTVTNKSTGVVATGTLTGVAGTAIPATTTLLGPRTWRSNNATALAVGIDLGGWFIESDLG